MRNLQSLIPQFYHFLKQRLSFHIKLQRLTWVYHKLTCNNSIQLKQENHCCLRERDFSLLKRWQYLFKTCPCKNSLVDVIKIITICGFPWTNSSYFSTYHAQSHPSKTKQFLKSLETTKYREINTVFCVVLNQELYSSS